MKDAVLTVGIGYWGAVFASLAVTWILLRRRRPNPGDLLVVGLAFAGVVLLYGASVLIQQTQAATSWEEAAGKVLISEARVARGNRTTADETAYGFRYQYTVKGDTYLASRYDWGGSIHIAVQQYDVGDKVTVHYNPADPQTAILEPSSGLGSLYLTIATGLFLLLPFVGNVIAMLVGRKPAIEPR